MATFTNLRETTFVVEECCNCGVQFGMGKRLRDARLKDQGTFYCPNGHGQHFTGPTPEQKLREQLEAEQRRVIQARAARDAAERSASAYKGQATRLRKRIGNGVCPCCNRHFANVERHIGNKHPEFAAGGTDG